MTTLLYGPLLRGTEVSIPVSRNSVTAAAAVKLGIFTIASVLVTGLLTVIMGNIGFGDTTKYSAMFSTASQLQPGDDVRVAGVSVGEVKDVEVYQRTRALVTFTARSDVPMTTREPCRDPLPQPGRRPLPRAGPGRPAAPSGWSPRRRSRSRTPRRRSTSPCCSTASSRCSPRSTPSRSTRCR